MSFYSYRDPDPKNSLRVYDETIAYLRDFVESEDDLENYIVGTTGDYDPYQSLKTSIRSATLEYLMGIDYDTKQKVLDQILNTSKDDIDKTLPLFEKVNEADNICIIGNKTAIEACRDSLDVIFDLNQK